MGRTRIIDGKKYSASLLVQAKRAAADGQVSVAESRRLWESATAGPKLSEINKRTLERIMDDYKFTEAAAKFLERKIKNKATSYFKQINGVRYDRDLWEEAKKMSDAEGGITEANVKDLIASAMDGGIITFAEHLTLEYALKNFQCTETGAAALREKLYPKVTDLVLIDGKTYCRELLEEIKKYAENGEVSEAQAKNIWDKACEGQPGVTDVNKETLEYALNKWKWSEDAQIYLLTRLRTEHMVATIQEWCDAVAASLAGTPLDEFIKPSNPNTQEQESMDEIIEKSEKSPCDIVAASLAGTPLGEFIKPSNPNTQEQESKDEIVEKSEKPPCDIVAVSLTGSPLDEFIKPSDPNIQEQTSKENIVEKSDKSPCAAQDEVVEMSPRVRDEVNKKVQEWRRQGLEKTEELEDEQEEYFGKFFDQMDTDGDGELTLQELTDYVATTDSGAAIKLGIGSWDDFVKNADLNGDGKIDREEFVIYGVSGNVDVEMAAGSIFDAMDTDGNSILDLDEIKDFEWFRNPHVFQVLGIVDFSSWVAGLDTNKDGQVDRDEFISYMKEKLVDENGKRNWKQSVDTAHAFQESGYHHNKKKRELDNNECWDYARGYCSRGANCRYTHKPEKAVDVSALQAKQKKFMLLSAECGVNLSSASLLALSTLDDSKAEELIKSVAEGGDHDAMDDEDKQFYIIRKARSFVAQSSDKSWSSKRRRKTY